MVENSRGPNRVAASQDMQIWEGEVESVEEGAVVCKLHDLSDESNPIEYAEIYIKEFNVYDRPLLREGTVFYWCVGRIVRPNGSVRRNSELRVRRFPALKRSQKTEINNKVSRLRDLLSGSSRRSDASNH